MNNKIKQKYKELIIELIEGDDWVGVRNLVDTILNHATPSVTINTPHMVEQVPNKIPDVDPPSVVEPSSADDERARMMEAKQEKLRG